MSNNTKVVNLSGGYILPQMTETYTKKPYIEVGLEGANDFFDVLTKRYLTSPTNNAVMDGVIDLLYGKGITFPDDEAKNEYFYSLTTENEVRKIVSDYKIFGNAAIQVHFSPDRQKIVSFFHTPVSNLRSEKCDNLGNINGYFYCSDWKLAEQKKLKATRIPAFNSGEYEENVQILYIKRYTPGKYYQGLPDYFSAIQYAAVEEEISNLHINNILNNFLPTTILNFNGGTPPEEEQFSLEQDIKNKFAGTSNAGRFIVSFNNNPEEKTTVEAIQQPNLHDQYKFIADEAQAKIMLAHRVTSTLLFGIRSASGFSSNADELKMGYDIFATMVIASIQKELLEAFTRILEYNGLDTTGILFDPLVPFAIKEDIIDSTGSEAAAEDITQAPQVDTEDQGDTETNLID